VVLADPPWEAEESTAFLALAAARLPVADGLIVMERDAARAPAPDLAGRLRRHRTARYGRTCFDFYVPETAPGADPAPG
jgi:16S rRNA G966 N2-methylase RsmD